jgi:molecular chaperone DnaK
VADAKKDLESNDADRMKSALEKISAVGAELYQEVQKAAQAGGAGPGAPDPSGAPDASGEAEGAGKKAEKKADVVDADFEVVDEEKKK